MSITKLSQRIRETAKALQAARDTEDSESVETLEDILYDLEDQLENEQRHSFSERLPLERP